VTTRKIVTPAKYPLESYAGRTLGPYVWHAFHAPSGLHYLRTPYPEKWIRLRDAQWESPDALFGLERAWFWVDPSFATRLVNPHVPTTPKRKRQRKGQFDIVTKP